MRSFVCFFLNASHLSEMERIQTRLVCFPGYVLRYRIAHRKKCAYSFEKYIGTCMLIFEHKAHVIIYRATISHLVDTCCHHKLK